MAGSWRIRTNEVDLTERATTSLPVEGATALIAAKGPATWKLFPKGAGQKIIDTFGYPDAGHPGIQDALDFNNVAPLWLSAPSTAGVYGGAFITSAGSIPFVTGTSTKSITSYAAIPCTPLMELGNGVKTIFTFTIPQSAYYVNRSINILVNNVSINISATDVPIEVLSTTPNVGSGTYTRATGALAFTFATAPALGATIQASYNINLASIIYCTLYDQNPQADDITVLVEKDLVTAGNFWMNVYRYNPVELDYFEIPNSPFNFSIDVNGLDDNGRNIYIEKVFAADNQTVFTAVVQNSTFSTFTNDIVAVGLAGGNRGTAISGTHLVTAYEDFKDSDKYNQVEIVFDTTGEATVATEFETLRNDYLKYCRFMLPTADLTATAIITTPLTAANNITNNRGIYYYCLTWGTHKDVYRGQDFNCSNMGLVATKMAQVLLYGPGGTPAWIDEGKIGGQLGSGVVKLNQFATEDQRRTLDSLNFNPVVIHPTYGPMIVSWKTRYAKQSDFNLIGQSSLTDWIIKLAQPVLNEQLGKLNDDYHRNLVGSKLTTILATLNKWLYAYVVDTSRDVNTDEVLAAQKFVASMGIQFTPYTSEIVFNFIVSRIGTDIQLSINATQ
jgi:hypothetical protein